MSATLPDTEHATHEEHSRDPRKAVPSLSNEAIIAELERQLGKRKVLSKLIERTSKAGDASIYRLVPRVVVQPANVADVRAIQEFCRSAGLYLTFRAAGTSLSGQAVTDGILVDLSSGWKGLRILDGGRRVAAEPGVIAANVNAFLAPHKAKIGPDPASINACMMGGVAANNASGMCCGVQFNSYHTMHSMKLMLADGLELDTSRPDADEELGARRPKLYQEILRIRDAIRSDSALVERISRKFAIKNTCGYAMNAFVDFDKPVDILSHVLIGSEGTLGFISEITLNTLPDKPFKATALVYFADLVDAGKAIHPLGQDAGAAVLEIMDRASMKSVEIEMSYPFRLDEHSPGAKALPIISGNCAALLIEFQEDSEESLATKLALANGILASYPLLSAVEFTRDPAEQAHFWHMRKGLFPSVGAMRALGTAVIIEDVCVEPRHLADCIKDIQQLFVTYTFPDAIIFGHAKDGNIHFVISTDFADAAQVGRYSDLMDELTSNVVTKYDGSLKAEHGTGRNIAPYVSLEWGEPLYGYMWDVKRLLDPDNILNPGVVLNEDPQVHLKNLKVMPAVSPVVDKCIECGFCEPRCPSRDLTTTPRQRIAVMREINRLLAINDAESAATAEELQREYEFYGNDTCATDGMCATSCPVKINTGDMIKDMRAEQHGALTTGISMLAAKNFGLLAWGARASLAFVHAGGPVTLGLARFAANLGNKVSGGTLPGLPKSIPVPAAAPSLPRAQKSATQTAKSVVYFPTCLTRSLGALPDEKLPMGLGETIVKILERCGRTVIMPKSVGSLCCGQPFFSKGFRPAGAELATRAINALWEATREGELPVVCDTSPCSGQFHHCETYLSGETLARWKRLRIIDFPTYLAKEIIPERTDWPRIKRHAILHPTCTLIKIGGLADLKKVASTFATEPEVPVLAECCGFAGDRGFLIPELTLSATRPESAEVMRESESAGSVRSAAGGNSPYVPYSETSLSQPTGIVPATQCDAPGHSDAGRDPDARCYSTCRTCEIGMTAGTGQTYSSIAYLVWDALCSEA